MPIVISPDLLFRKFDPKTGTSIKQDSLLANARTCHHHMGKRFLWVSNLTANTLSRIDPGQFPLTVIKSTSLSGNPNGLWGGKRWLWKISSAGSVDKIDPKTVTVVKTFTLTGVFLGLTGLGRYAWTYNVTSGNIEKYDLKTWTLVSGFTAPANTVDVHRSKRWLWILTGAASTTGTIKKYDPKKGTQISSFNTRSYTLGEGAFSITGRGRFLYVLDAS